MNSDTSLQSLIKDKKTSLASSYLFSVLENKAKDNTRQTNDSAVLRVGNAFSSLQDVIPHCGIYTPVLQLIREELIDAVYSDTFTTAKDKSSTKVLERIPYFVLLQRLKEQRIESTDILKNQIKELEAEVEKCKQNVMEKEQVIFKIEVENDEIAKSIAMLTARIEEKDGEIDRIQKKHVDAEKEMEQKLIHLKQYIVQLKDSKKQLQSDAGSLRHFKVAYDKLKDTFDLPPDKRPRRGFRRPVISTKKTQILVNIEAAAKLEQQIVDAQTKSLEEYDVYLEEVKRELTSKKLADHEHETNFFNEELQLETLTDEMNSRLRNFQRLVSSSVVELELVRQHRDALQGQLSQMEQAETTRAPAVGGDGAASPGGATPPPSSMAGGPGSSRMMTHDDGEKKTNSGSPVSGRSGLEEDTTPVVDPSNDPFNPQERLLSKYSAMIYTSTNAGKSFDEIECAKFCPSCHEKTVVCPHKITKSDMVVQLPKGCSHIKVSRPMIRISIPAAQQQGVQESEAYVRRHQNNWFGDSRAIGIHDRWNDSDHHTHEEHSIRRQLAPLWEDAKRRAGIDTATGSATGNGGGVGAVCTQRDHTLHRVFSIMEQFYASVTWRDEHASPDDDVFTLKEYLYNFMSDRYQEEEIAPSATCDFITAVVKYATQDKTVLVLGLALTGLIDGSIVRYVHIVADLIDEVEWKETRDFKAFVDVLYPMMHEDDAEQLIMEYTAFSENKISKTLVMNYIIHIIIKNREPRILAAESQLLSAKAKEKGVMTADEFSLAMESIAPLASEQLIHRLSHECMRASQCSVVLIRKLAPIGAYAVLLQVWPLLKEQVCDKITEARKLPPEVVTKLTTSNNLVEDRGELLTMSQIKLLAGNQARQRQAGNRQSQLSFNDDEHFWSSKNNLRY